MLIDRKKIVDAKENLGIKNALIMAKELNLENFDERNLKGSCAFHSPDDTPSLIYNSKNHTFHCFSCQKTVDIIDVFMMGGLTYLEAVKKLFEEAKIPYAFGELGVKTKHSYRYPKATSLNGKETIIEYWAKRGISKETLDWADVREDTQGNTVFNYYDSNDVLTMVKYRPSRRVEHGENKMWCQKDADTTPLLFNMNRVNTEVPLLITEGEGDALAAIEAGYTNVVSIPLGAGNYAWIEQCWDFLEQFDQISICSDNDEAGNKMRQECIDRLGSWRTKFVDLPPSFENENGEQRRIKDLNEALFFLGKQKTLDLILNARDTPVDSVIDFSDIKNIDLDDLDGIDLCNGELKKKLRKFFYKSLTILTGINGSGKTSFICQQICEAIEKGKPTWLYSGEMDNSQIKNWMSFILAGQRGVNEYLNEGEPYYKIKPENLRKIEAYYKGLLHIYKDDRANTTESALKSMEDCIRKHGVKFLIVDNLTSLRFKKGESKWDQQGEFITDLIDLAKKYNVAVVLVVHPHKLEMMRRMNKMDVAGISAVIDLSHRIFSLYRVSEDEKQGNPYKDKNGKTYERTPVKWDVLIDVLKDRYTGREGYYTGNHYDRPSKRFFATEKELDKIYSWDTNDYSKVPLPFPPQQLLTEEDPYGKMQGDTR